MQARAFAKLNLGLRIRGITAEGLHRIDGLFQSIDWFDSLELERSDEDVITGRDGREVIDGWDNLAWRAATLAREHAEASQRLRLVLDKHIPVAAGLGGGSADAAAALATAGVLFGIRGEDVARLAPQLGSDVPFCLTGGLAVVSGVGEQVAPLVPARGYATALVVPPAELSTPDVYSAWDLLEGPSGPSVTGRDLPPELRDYGPLANDLYPAAVAVAPAVDEWRAELSSLWNRPVMLTGSGPTLFAYFVDAAEATEALEVVPVGARATRAAVPVDRGWRIESPEPRIQNPD